MNCNICDSISKELFKARVLKKYDVRFYHCDICGFLQTEEPRWLEQAYKKPINSTDVGLLSRNVYFSKMTAAIIYYIFGKNIRALDYAGGYGIFVRLMRDAGFDFYWQDSYAENLFATGFEYDPAINKTGLITSFECFEHFTDPMKDIAKILDISNNVIFSTQILPSPVPEPHKWWYYGLDHGQHVSFYSLKTLNYIAGKFNLNLYSNNCDYHIITPLKLNTIFLKFLMRFNAYLFEFLIKRKMNSLTSDDFSLLLKGRTVE